MKYFVLLGDGMADLPVKELNGLTPLACAKKPLIDKMASLGEVGMVNITPEGCKGGSDVGNLAALGYDPRKYLTGRAPLEAAAMGLLMANDDAALRCNLACVSNENAYEDKYMLDYSSDEITTEESAELIKALNKEFASSELEFHAGISYRHCLIIHHCGTDMTLTPPHNITGRSVREYLPKGEKSDVLFELMKKSYKLLSEHPVNIKRVANGKKPANTVWFWGQGSKPGLSSFSEKYKKRGCAVTAVDLVRGIAFLAGMDIKNVEGATGTLETNFVGKANAALNAFDEGADFCYLHFEAPDECGHRHEIERKIRSIEMLDKVLSIVCEGLKKRGEEYGVLIMPDHPTPVSTGAHSSAPVPYVIYYSNNECASGINCYCEKTAEASGVVQKEGYELLPRFLS